VTAKIEILSEVEGSNLKRNRKQLVAAIAHFEGKPVTITIERTKRKRSNPQNRWYWGVALPIVRQALNDNGNPFTTQHTHELLKVALIKICPEVVLDETVIESTGEVLQRIRSTAEFTTSEFMDFKSAIQQWSAEVLGVEIPDPNEQISIEL
jgi:hypothetical protein